jgi:large repetitive protein
MLNFEKLEDRKLLAVSASQKGSTLNVVGTNGDDVVAVDGQVATPGVVIVTDGETGVQQLFIGVKTVNVDTKGGIDVVAVNLTGGDAITGNLNIKTGDGIDIVIMQGGVLGNLSVDTGKGSDLVAYDALLVTGATKISTGANEDAVLGGVGGNASIFIGNVTIDTGDATDIVAADGNLYQGSLTVNLGKGDDFYAETNAVIGGPLSVNGGAGLDEILDLGGTIVLGDIKIKNVEIP